MLLILKIPLVYVCVVVWYAIKAEPTPPDAEVGVVADTPPAGGSPRRPRRAPSAAASARTRPRRWLGITRSPARGRDGVRA